MAPHLHEAFPGLRGDLPHRTLGRGPTPVSRLAGLEAGGAEVWLKDEGRFGDGGWGGNKVRKLEWLIPDALRRRRRTILTFGGLGTNWGLATALYAREAGLATALALVDQPVDDHVRAQLDRLRGSGATLHFTHARARTVAALPLLLARHASGARPPYLLPAGGSSPLGAIGYVEVGFELAAQVRAGELPEPAWVVTAVGTGGTAAGLLLGLRLAGLSTGVLGVVVNDQLRLDPGVVRRLAGRSARLLARRGAVLPPLDLGEDRLWMTREWLGPGYGHATVAAEGARAAARERAGLELDPVYTAKAMAALLALREAGSLAGPSLFLNTNGPR